MNKMLNCIIADRLTEAVAINNGPYKVNIIGEFGIDSKFIFLPTSITE